MVVLDSIIITRPFWATHYPGVLQVENHVVIGVILKQGFFPWSFVLLKRLNLAPCVWRSIVGESFRNTPIYFSHTLQILLQVWIYIPHFLCRVNKNKPSSIDQAGILQIDLDMSWKIGFRKVSNLIDQSTYISSSAMSLQES